MNTIGKDYFTALYSPARRTAFTQRNIKSGFAAAGLFPFNPDRVLKTMSKPPPEPTTAEAEREQQLVEPSYLEDEVQSPTTPVSVEGLVSLHNMIVQQKNSTHASNETSTQRFLRLIQKLAKAAQMSIAKGILQQEHIEFLMTINNEAKIRRSTKSVVLGKAVVMGYEQLEEARAKRNEKDAAKATKGKGKRGRKRKSAAPEVDMPDEATKGKGKRGQKRKSDALEVDMPEADVLEAHAPEPKAKEPRISAVSDLEQSWRAPVAKMY